MLTRCAEASGVGRKSTGASAPARAAVRAALEGYFMEVADRMSYEDLPCNDFVELATEYLEGVLPIERASSSSAISRSVHRVSITSSRCGR